MFKSFLAVLAFLACSLPIFAQQTWYVRKDGGTRYSLNVPAGQCNGKYDASYASTGGVGFNQNCAYNDPRLLWDDKSGKVLAGAWVIAGGDTVILRGGPWRLGWDGPTGDTSGNWCYTVGSYTCFNPPIPSGTATQHTRILGENYASCNNGGATNPKLYASNLTQLFGGFSLTFTFNLQDTQYVDVQCIELTTHNGKCTLGGDPAYPRGCSSNQPLDDYAQNGIVTNANTSGLTLQDVYIHGFNASGTYGPIGGAITQNRVFVGFNGFAGENFDNEAHTPDAPGSKILASYVTLIGNGCYEEYPVAHDFPAQACYDDVSNGFGDAWSGQDTDLDTFICDHCEMAYNTKDAFIGPHTNVKTLTITNSQSYGNMGAQWKWNNTPGATVTFENNRTVGNCLRFQATIPGAAHSFALSSGLPGAYLSDYCRAGGNTVAINSQQNSSVLFAHNTFVDYLDTVFLLSCGPNNNNQNGMCGTTPFVFTSNIFLGYFVQGGLAPGLFYINDPSITVTQNNNVQYGNRVGYGEVCGVNGNICADPLLVNEPIQQAWTAPEFLDNFNFNPSASSPANTIAAGATFAVTATAPVPPVTSPIPPIPPVQTWTKVANEGDVVNVPAGTTVRYGFGTQWSTPMSFATATTFTATNAFFGGDPYPNQVKEVDALGTGTGITVGPIAPPTPTLPTITWTTPASIVYGTTLTATQLNATASVSGTFVYTPAAGSIPAAGTDTLSVTFTPTDAVDFTNATASVKLVVTQPVKTVPTVTWSNPASIKVGTALSTLQLNATASVPGKFVYTPAAGTVLPQGTNALSVTFTPTNTASYTPVSKSVQIVVTPMLPCSGTVSYSISATGVMSLGAPSACK